MKPEAEKVEGGGRGWESRQIVPVLRLIRKFPLLLSQLLATGSSLANSSLWLSFLHMHTFSVLLRTHSLTAKKQQHHKLCNLSGSLLHGIPSGVVTFPVWGPGDISPRPRQGQLPLRGRH